MRYEVVASKAVQTTEPTVTDPAESELLGVPLHAPARSEERRVGKECRSRCDWSSDVCSSDLNAIRSGGQQSRADNGTDRHRSGRVGIARRSVARARKIGRASCRERV